MNHSTSWYEQSNTNVDNSIEKHLEIIYSISVEVGKLGKAWQFSIETALKNAKPEGLATATLNPKLHTARFLANSKARTEVRIENYSTALRERPRPRLSKPAESEPNWKQWFEKQILVSQLAKFELVISNANNEARLSLDHSEVTWRKKKMVKTLGKLLRIAAGLLPGLHSAVATTETIEALNEFFRGLEKQIKKPLDNLVESLDEMDSIEMHLVQLEACLYLIPSKEEVENEREITISDAMKNLKLELNGPL